MIKLITLSLVGAGVVGTGAQTFTPQALEISAGAMVFELGAEGFDVNLAETPDFAITIKAKGDRQFTVRL